MLELMGPSFILTAIASVVFGAIGTFVVARRIGYLTGSIAHSAFGGVSIGLWIQECVKYGAFGSAAIAACFLKNPGDAYEVCFRLSKYVSPVLAAFLFAIFAAILVDWIRCHAHEREETVLGAIWAIGAAVGLLVLEQIRDYVSPTSILFGDVLFVTRRDIILTACLGLVILALLLVNFKKLEAVCFDEEFAELRGINVRTQNRLLLILTAVTVVLLSRLVGMALIVAMLTLPAAAVSRFTKRLGTTIVASIVLCFIGSWIGIATSYWLDISTGPTIILIVAIFYVAALVLRQPLHMLSLRTR